MFCFSDTLSFRVSFRKRARSRDIEKVILSKRWRERQLYDGQTYNQTEVLAPGAPDRAKSMPYILKCRHSIDWLNKVLDNGKSILIEQTYSQGSCWIIEFWLGPRGAGVKWGLCLLKSLLELDIRRNNVWGKIENGIRIKLTSVFKAPCSWRGEDIFLIFLFLPQVLGFLWW